VFCLEAVAYSSHCNTWSGSVGTEACLSGQLASFGALMLLVGSSGLYKSSPKMTYKVSSIVKWAVKRLLTHPNYRVLVVKCNVKMVIV